VIITTRRLVMAELKRSRRMASSVRATKDILGTSMHARPRYSIYESLPSSRITRICLHLLSLLGLSRIDSGLLVNMASSFSSIDNELSAVFCRDRHLVVPQLRPALNAATHRELFMSRCFHPNDHWSERQHAPSAAKKTQDNMARGSESKK